MSRRRRSAEEAREEILHIAQTSLLERGPDALRLHEVAAEMGVSRQAVLHHFGSREELLREVVRRAWLGLFEELRDLVSQADDFTPARFLERVDEVTRRRGNARLGAWLLLSGEGLPATLFQDALAGLPAALTEEGSEPRDARYTLLLAGAALFGDALFGVRLRQALGLVDSEEARADFREWMAARLWPRR